MDDAKDNIFTNRRYFSDSATLVIHLQIQKFNSSFKFQSTEEIGAMEIRLVNLYRIP
jgi:hypothetical protein